MNTFRKQAPALYPIVLSHYLASGFCFVVFSAMLLCAAGSLHDYYFQPQLLAITHMAALGWATLIIFGAAYQLIPVVFETDLYSFRLPWLSFACFIPGLILLVYSFWLFDTGLYMQAGGLLVLLAILIFCYVVFRTAARSANRSIQHDYILTACIWLASTAVMGVLLVFNFSYAFLPKDHLHFLKLHAHMGLSGWFLLLIIGVSSKLIPMFIVSRDLKNSLLVWAYYLTNASLLLFLADTYLNGINVKTYFIAGLSMLALAAYIAYVYGCFKSRVKKKLDLPIVNTLISIAMLAVAMLVLPLISYFHLKADPRSVQYSTLYGSLLLIGWLSSIICGQTFKTLPFIVWINRYEHLAGKARIPLPAELYKENLLKLQTLFFILFGLTFFAGLFFKNPILTYTGAACLLASALLYMLNLCYLIFSKTQTSHDRL